MALQYMTQEGLDKLKKELAEAIAQRPVISAAIAEPIPITAPDFPLITSVQITIGPKYNNIIYKIDIIVQIVI